MATATQRAYSAAHYLLELDGKKDIGIIRSVDGGGVKSEIMTYQMGEAHDLWRQIGKPKYEDLKLEFSMSFSKEFYEWIKAFFEGKVERRNGAIVAGDFHYKSRARREFQEALISEITFPKLDGGDKNACYMQATLVPETMRFAPGDGKDLQASIGALKQKLWTAANFQFNIDGMSEQCKRVTKVDSFTIKQQVQEYHAGELRDPIRVPGILEFPNITFHLPESDAKPFIDHFTTYAIKGTLQKPARLTGSIEMRDNAGSDLCRVDLFGIDLANIASDKSEAGSDSIKEVKIEIAVERMAFAYQQSGLD